MLEKPVIPILFIPGCLIARVTEQQQQTNKLDILTVAFQELNVRKITYKSLESSVMEVLL